MSRLALAGPAALMSVLAVIVPGAGAAVWSTPAPILGSQGLYPGLALLGTANSANVFLTGPLALIPLTAPQVPVALASKPAGGAFGSPVPFGAYADPVAASPSGQWSIAVAGPRSPADYFSVEHGKPVKLRVVIQKLGAALHRVATGHATATRSIDAAVNNSGDAVVMYSSCRTVACSTTSVWAIRRRNGGPFSKPVELAGKTFTADGSVAIDASGDALLAWSESRAGSAVRTYDVRTRLWNASGHLTALRRAGPTVAHPQIDITLSNRRTGTIAWFTEPVSEGSVGGPVTVSATRMSSDGRLGSRTVLDRFSPPGTSNGANAVGGARLKAILDPDGGTTVAWTGSGNRYLVMAVRVPGGLQPQALSPAGQNAELTDLVGDRNGDAMAVWVGGAQSAASGGTPVPGVGVAVRTGTKTLFAFPDLALVNSSARSYRTAAGAISGPAPPHLLIAASGEVVVGSNNPPPVVTTERTG